MRRTILGVRYLRRREAPEKWEAAATFGMELVAFGATPEEAVQKLSYLVKIDRNTEALNRIIGIRG
jgi:hypothetical protein